jgi:microcystin-dependent protein
VTTVGGHAAHENRSPFMAVGFIIALNGIFPSQG